MTTRASYYIEGLDKIQAELREMDAKLRREVLKAARDVTDMVATSTKAAASTPAEQRTASTIRRSGSTGVKAGGSSSAGAMFFGTEFGGQRQKTTMQFRPHLGRQGYFFWPAIRQQSHAIVARWRQVLEEVVPDHG